MNGLKKLGRMGRDWLSAEQITSSGMFKSQERGIRGSAENRVQRKSPKPICKSSVKVLIFLVPPTSQIRRENSH